MVQKNTAKKKASAKVQKTSVDPVEVKTPEAAPAAPGQDASQLTIADLQAIAQVIDAAVRRGAFGASEVTEVGVIYTKLAGFLKIIADQQREANPEGGA